MKKKLMVSLAAFAFGFFSFASADANPSTEWSKETYALHSKIVDMGMKGELARGIINECKATAANPRRCVELAVSVSKAESSLGNRVNSCNNVFSIIGSCYPTKKDAVKDWVKRYNRSWYRQKNPSSFYSSTPHIIPPTRYCMGEHSSGSKGFCPNGHRAAWQAFNYLNSK